VRFYIYFLKLNFTKGACGAMNLKKISLAVMLFIFLSSCATNPVTGRKELMLISRSQEIAIGKKNDKQIIAQYGLYNNSNLKNYINEIGYKLVRHVHRHDISYYFRILDSTDVNAFALPGGYVYITRGILAYINNEAQLAGILGHELGHINARHSAKQMSEAMLFNLGLTVGSIVSPEINSLSNLISTGVKLLFLKFSRDDENQADYLGVYYSTQAGYDSKELGNFFNTLKRLESKKSSGLPSWFSTHPSPKNRIRKVIKETKDIQRKFNRKKFTINRNRYLKKINGLIFGKDPQQGYVEKNYFYHPVLKFKFYVNPVFKVENTPSKVLLISKKNDSIIIFHLNKYNNLHTAVNKYVANSDIRTFYEKNISINGFSAIKTKSILRKNNLVIISYFILKDKRIFQFDCVYKNYNERYISVPMSFSTLTEVDKLNKKPYRIKIFKLPISGTFANIVKYYNVKDKELIKKLVVLNGINMDTYLKKGTLIKILVK